MTLALNPHLSFSTAGESALTVFAPVKGEGLRITDVAEGAEPEIFDLLKRLRAGDAGDGLNLTDRQEQRLSELGVLVTESNQPSAVRFACPLQGPPRELIPRRASDSFDDEERAERLVVNPTFRYLDGRRWEQKVAATINGADRFLRRGSWAWVQEAGAAAPCIYWVAPEEQDLLSSLAAGAAAPALIDGEARRRLSAAGLLVAEESLERWRASREERLRAARAKFRESLYAVVPGLLHPLQVAALRQYYRQLIAEGYLTFGDSQVPFRYAAQNEPLSRFLHGELAGLVGLAVGEEVKPSYVYFASYRQGAILHPHKDREQCEFSLSLLLDYVPEPDGLSPWPLLLRERGPEGRETAVSLGLGDGLVYKGRELAHRRERLPEGHSSSSFFFHYVRRDFGGRLD